MNFFNVLPLNTPRLLLRSWKSTDLKPFIALNSDPVVMEHFPRAMTADESTAMVERIQSAFERDGFGLWALEEPGKIPFAGFVGLARPRFEAPFMPVVEIGWRLCPEAWGQGFATEAARAVLDFGFRTAGLREIVAFTVPSNGRSRRVMEKLGMTHDPADDFDHPSIDESSPFRRHVLYRITSDAARLAESS